MSVVINYITTMVAEEATAWVSLALIFIALIGSCPFWIV